MSRRDLPYAPDARLGFEMALLRMLAFRPDDAGTERPASSARLAPRPAAAAPVAAAPAAPAVAVLPPDAPWEQRVDALGLEGFAKQLARNCAWAFKKGTEVSLSLAASAKHLLQEERRAMLERALGSQLGEAIRLSINVVQEAVATPAQLTQKREEEKQRAAEAAITGDPGVQAFKDIFGATVKPGSTQALE